MSVLQDYRKHFGKAGDIDTWALVGTLSGEQLEERLLRAITENILIDIEKEYGIAPPTPDSDS